MATATENIPMVQVALDRLAEIDKSNDKVGQLIDDLIVTIGRWQQHHTTAQNDLACAQGEVARLRAELENRPTPDRSEAESLKNKVAQLERAVALKDQQLKEVSAKLADLEATDLE
jgi:prefoldin subunit 5